MLQKNFAGCSGVILDWCKPHGFWFERQELARVVAFVQEGGLTRARELEQTHLREEQDRLRSLQAQPVPGCTDLPDPAIWPGLSLDTDLIEILADVIRKLFS